MLVDDEPIFIDDLFTEISKANLRFEVTQQCISSAQALKCYRDNPCDVVFTDIQMPEMDGLQMTVEMKKTNPNVVVIFLTGYGKIEYAQSAIRCGGFDFLLKPLKKDDLISTLKKTEDFCDKMLFAQIRNHLNSMHIGGKTDGIACEGISLSFTGVSMGAFLERYKPIAVSQDYERKAQSVFDASTRFFETQGNRFVWTSKNVALNGVIIAVDQDMSQAERETFFERIKQAAAPYPITLTTLECEYACDEWIDAIRTVQSMVRERKLFARSSMIEKCEKIAAQNLQPIEIPYDLLSKALQKRDFELQQQIWNGITNTVARNLVKASEMEEMLHHICNIVDQVIDKMEERKHCRSKIFEAAYYAEDAASCLNEVFNIILQYSGMLNDDVSNRMLAKKIETYLYRNMGNDITIEDIANEFSYNASYIHRVFKREYKKTPMKFLNEIRIAQAIRLLDSTPSIRIQDIAWNVGFSDQYYFSRVFKQATGTTPVEYQAKRSKHKNNNDG